MSYSVSKPIDQLELVVLLIRSSTYDRDGYLIQWKKGSFPSNSLAVLYGLTKEAFASPELKDLKSAVVYAFDELVRKDKINPEEMMERYGGLNKKVVVGFVGVQTNMFPRTQDLARRFKKLGAVVVIGGYHVTGAITVEHDGINPRIPCPHIMPTECAELMDEGIILYHGEAESLWAQVLSDICHDRPQPLYRGGCPDITDAPLPQYPPGYFDGFFRSLRTLDTSRGCPYSCTFCCIHNVQGHAVRPRNVAGIVKHIRDTYRAEGKIYWCFTDDNFSRNPLWEDLLIELMALQREGLKFSFFVQVDGGAWQLNGKKTGKPFAELLALAGCTQAFIGIESVHQETLKQAGKSHNKADSYDKMCKSYHQFGIVCHASVMVGHPTDTPERIRQDIETLKADGFDQASFYIRTLLPGSEDHIRAKMSGVEMDPDPNNYDAQQPIADHALMSRDELQEAYERSWKQFYSKEQVVATLLRIGLRNYWGPIVHAFWYRWSKLCEGVHPMLAGFLRFRSLRDRRHGAAPLVPARYIVQEFWRYLRYVRYFFCEFYFFQYVYFQTHWLPQRRDTRKHLGDLHESFSEYGKMLYGRHRTWRQQAQKSSWFARTFGATANRKWLNHFWRRYGNLKWRLLAPHKWLWHLKMLPHAISEVWYTIRFWIVLLRAMIKRGS